MLTILVAHHDEGRAFIEHYAMTPDVNAGCGRCYRGDGVALQVIGQGAPGLATSPGNVFEETSVQSSGRWLNFGVAGSAQYPRGSVLEVTEIADGNDQSATVFHLPALGLADNTNALSFMEPQSDYPDTGVVDMEARVIAGCLTTQSQLTALTVIKLVADGPSAGISTLTRGSLRQLLADAGPTITAISDKLLNTK